MGLALSLAACGMSDFQFGSFNQNDPAPTPQQSAALQPAGYNPMQANLPLAQGESFGTGPVRVALLLPLSGDPALASVGLSMANASKLAMSFIETNPNIADNITVVLKDTGASAGTAAQAASQAVAEGASIILGPLKADQVSAAGAVARAAGIPLIGFSNNSSVAAPGIYLLNVLPETEVHRSLGFAQAKGHMAYAGIFPTTDFGRIQQGAFLRAASDLGLGVKATFDFAGEAEARSVVAELAPLIKAGQIDTLFLPDRATAPSFATLLEEAGVAPGSMLIIGSADWEADPTIARAAYLSGAVFPAVDEAGYMAMKADYQARFGGMPHPLATMAFTATILANTSILSLGTPRYDRAQLTLASGFNGRDGVFRFLPDGRSEYALVMKQVGPGGAIRVEGAKL